MKAIVRVALTAAASCLAACAGSRGVDKAFTDSKSAVQGNSHTFRASPEMTLRVVTGTLVQKGFAIEQVDSAMGLIKASRNLTDPKDANTNYHISATAYVSADADIEGSVVSLAASQQTVLYRKGHTWTMLPLLPIIPIPTGKKYETVVTGEGSILQGDFYADFFAAVERGLTNAALGATRLAAGTASPARAAPVAAEPSAGSPAATQGSPAAADGAPR
jgi:hypothetical protein